MANRIFDKLLGLGKDRVVITGRFSPAGTGAVTGVLGAGFRVARTGVGLFSVTLQDKYPAMLHSDAKVWLATPSNVVGKPISYTAATNVIVFAAWDPAANAGAGGGADVAANAANFITFQITMSNSSIVMGG